MAALAAAALLAPLSTPAQPTAADDPGAVVGAHPTRSGYTQEAALEGGDSVTEDLSQDDVPLGSVLRFPRFERFFDPWFDAKRRLNEKLGLKLQMSYQLLYQWTDETSGEDQAAAGRARCTRTA